MNIYSENFTVTVPDVGINNTITNRGFLRMLQEIACIHSDKSGISVNDINITGKAWILLNWKLHIFSRPTWNTKLTIKTWPSQNKLACSYRDFEIFDDKNNLVAIATSKWVLYDLFNGSIVKITDNIRTLYPEVNKHVFAESMNDKLKEPENNTLVSEYKILRRDIDSNHHLNNVIYLDLAYETLPDDIYSNSDFNNVEIMYKHQAKLGETLKLFYSKTDNESIVTIKNSDADKVHCIVKLY